MIGISLRINTNTAKAVKRETNNTKKTKWQMHLNA